jgi:hypothetical protein
MRLTLQTLQPKVLVLRQACGWQASVCPCGRRTSASRPTSILRASAGAAVAGVVQQLLRGLRVAGLHERLRLVLGAEVVATGLPNTRPLTAGRPGV